MMDWTDRHCRFFHRLLTRRTLIYTEMVTTGAVLNGDRARLIGFDRFEHPVALQLGGSDAHALTACARIAEDLGYDEVNLNVGCPSDRVQEGRFGARLNGPGQPSVFPFFGNFLIDPTGQIVTIEDVRAAAENARRFLVGSVS